MILSDSSLGRRFFCKSGDISSGFFYGELTSKFSFPILLRRSDLESRLRFSNHCFTLGPGD